MNWFIDNTMSNIKKIPRARNSGTIVVIATERELHLWLDSEKSSWKVSGFYIRRCWKKNKNKSEGCTSTCPIVKNPRACNSGTIGVKTTKREIDMWLDSEKPHGKFQVSKWNGVEKNPWKTVTCMCPIVKYQKARNSRTIGVTSMKCKLDMWLDSEKPHGKFQVPIWNGVEKKKTRRKTSTWICPTVKKIKGHVTPEQSRCVTYFRKTSWKVSGSYMRRCRKKILENSISDGRTHRLITVGRTP
jgi:hypothetical protein